MLLRILIFFIGLVLCHPSVLFAAPSETDKEGILQGIQRIEQSLDRGDVESIVVLLSPRASPVLREEIEDVLRGNKIHFTESIGRWIEVSPSLIRLEGHFSASSSGWEIKGLWNYFVFEKVSGRWLLYETDFHQKMSAKFWWKTIKTVLVFAGPVFILTCAFWIWMLVDCLNRPSKEMWIWVLVLIFLSLLGAILYFFIERKKSLLRLRMAAEPGHM